MHFQSKTQNIQTFCFLKNTAVIQAYIKFYTMLKCSSWVIPKCAPHIEEPCCMPALTDFDEVLHSDILGLQSTRAVDIFKCIKFQDDRWPPFKKL